MSEAAVVDFVGQRSSDPPRSFEAALSRMPVAPPAITLAPSPEVARGQLRAQGRSRVRAPSWR